MVITQLEDSLVIHHTNNQNKCLDPSGTLWNIKDGSWEYSKLQACYTSNISLVPVTKLEDSRVINHTHEPEKNALIPVGLMVR